MQNFIGVIIEESLTNKKILSKVKINETKVVPVNEKHQTPHLKQWTLHTIEILADNADDIALELSKTLEGNENTGYWYADYKNNELVYIVFPIRIFKIAQNDPEGFQKARDYGISLGIPEYQLSFYPE
ncbi:hypothetical protein KJ652_06170 [Patescibacteria group bacterium]|nr:hypothetical protein [Patescibacteria group bacterium]MBU1124137.1 hypothetical protein [Patescibacteria group bacterium]MBU1911415.1 hypothetical protein [Patescibacteria group bacterium]